jgi:hypothetical protein
VPDPLRHLSTFAEDAVSDVRLIVHDYFAARTASTATTTVGRFGGSGVGFGDRATQFAVANVVGVVEHYAEQVLLDAGSNPKKVKTWGDKPTAWKTAFDADIEDDKVCPSFKPMRGFYEARNAIMHRRGELTHSQRTDAVYDRLAAAHVERVGHHIVVTDSTVVACAEVCVRCVEELDNTIHVTSP